MPQHLKMFEWLVYASLALDVAWLLLFRPTWEDAVGVAVIIVIVVALTWAAARRGLTLAAWALVFLAVLGGVLTLAEVWGGAPTWLSNIVKTDTPSSTSEKVVSVISLLLLVAALYYYFFGADRARRHA
jgi:hypothetical protein